MENSLIRPARPEEFPAMAALLEAQYQEHNIQRTAAEVEEVLRIMEQKPEFGFALVASEGEKLVGVAYAPCILSLEHGGFSGWLEDIYIAPEGRGKGLGSLLLKAVIAAAEERGWKALDLEVDAGHQKAIPLYQRHGYEPVPRTRLVRRMPPSR